MEENRQRSAEIAHDFNNLLTVINGQSEWMLRKLTRGDAIRPGLEAIYRAGLRAAELARELLAISGAVESANGEREIGRSAGEDPGAMGASIGTSSAARILIADDESQVRGYIRTVLEDAGYLVTEAEDGKEAVKQVRTGAVDLVITDLVMPDQEGLETIQILRRQAPEVAIVAISGAFHPEYLDVARKLGAVVALPKPLTAEELLRAVADALRARPA
jgi:CheY-like chemotaxis protein